MCKALNSNAISELSDEYHVRTCRRDELDIWKEMPFDDMKSAKEYNGFMTEYFNDVYAWHDYRTHHVRLFRLHYHTNQQRGWITFVAMDNRLS